MSTHGRTSPYRLARRIIRAPAAVRIQDAALNRWWRDREPGILLVRHPRKDPWFYGQFLDWLGLNFPQARRHFELALLGSRHALQPSRSTLLVPWLQDPIQQWSMEAYEQACAIAARFQAQGVPVVNAPAALVNAAKSSAAATARGLDIRAARSFSLTEDRDLHRAAAELGFPLLVRPDWGHRHQAIRVDSHDDINRIDERMLQNMQTPVAMEFVDTRGHDGLFRKYRFLAAGDRSVSVHMIASRHWEVRGETKVLDDALRADELAFINQPNPHAETFHRLRRALGLDLVAFDYAHDQAGRLVVWEANPYPSITFGPDTEALRYRAMPVHRCFAAMAALYLSRGDFDIPPGLDALLADASAPPPRRPAMPWPRRVVIALERRTPGTDPESR